MALWIKYKQVGLDLKAVLVWAIIWSLTARFFFLTCPKGTPWSKDKWSLKVMELSVLGMNYVRQKCLWFYIAWPDLSIIIFIYMIGIDLHLWDRAFAWRLNDIIVSYLAPTGIIRRHNNVYLRKKKLWLAFAGRKGGCHANRPLQCEETYNSLSM